MRSLFDKKPERRSNARVKLADRSETGSPSQRALLEITRSKRVSALSKVSHVGRHGRPKVDLHLDRRRADIADAAWRSGKVTPEQLVQLLAGSIERIIDREKSGKFGPRYHGDEGQVYWQWEGVDRHINLIARQSMRTSIVPDAETEKVRAFQRYLESPTVGRPRKKGATLEQPVRSRSRLQPAPANEGPAAPRENLQPEAPLGHTGGTGAKPDQAPERFRDYRDDQIPDEKLAFIAANLHRLGPGLLTRLYNALSTEFEVELPRGMDGRPIPTTPPALWKNVPARRGANYISPAKFLYDTYSNWIEAGVLSEDHVGVLDPDLLASYKVRITNAPEEKIAKLNPASKTEREVADLFPLLSREDIQRLGQAIAKRGSRSPRQR